MVTENFLGIATVLLTAVLALATVVLAWATLKYVRAVRQPLVSGYFETDGTWIYLVIQNTGSDVALDTSFSIDLTSEELEEIFGPNLHGQRYIVYEDLTFLSAIKQLAPGQEFRHQWLFLNFVLRDRKPRPCQIQVNYSDRWGKDYDGSIPFDWRQFGTYDMSHLPDPAPIKVIAESLRKIERGIEKLADNPFELPGE